MKTTFDFAETTPREPQRYSTPEAPVDSGLLVWSGSSSFGSHAIRGLLGCARAAALTRPWAKAQASDRSGAVRLIAESEGVLRGPVEPGHELGQSVYMIRGTFIHTAIAHALIHESLQRKEDPIVVGRHLSSMEGPWYEPKQAVEAAAVLVGPPGFRYALPAARVMLGKAVEWARDLVRRERVVAIETQFGWHVDGPWTYTARFDLITVNRASGLFYGYDYKTAVKLNDAKAKYAKSAQLMGQHQMGRIGYGDRWGGVKVILVEDTGERPPTYPQEWKFPVPPRAADMRAGIEEAMRRAPVNPAAAIPNPLYCSGCPAHVHAACSAL